MIRVLRELDPFASFFTELNRDPDYSDPHLLTEEQMQVNLRDAVEKQSDLVLGVFEGERMTGLFVFLVLPEERYLEMIVGLSRSDAAYREILDLLRAWYPGFQADFVLNPRNSSLKRLLEERKAAFDPVQRRMSLQALRMDWDTDGIVPLSEPYYGEYIAIHNRDVYWTAERIIQAPDRFRALLAVEAGHVVGYLDFTLPYDENEIYDLWVREQSRRRGWGRKLMTAALRENQPKGMLLFVDADNAPAIRLYESLGFSFVPRGDNLTVSWMIPE